MTAAQLSPFQRWSILAGAAILLSLAMGMRQSFGLFQPSILHDTAITTADFSLATALVFTIGCGLCIGLALSCTASSMTMTVTSRTVSAAKRSVAMGAVSAAGSLGLVIASPLAQTLISTAGWQMALIGFLGLAAVMLPAAIFAGRADRIEIEKSDDIGQSIGTVVQSALGHSGFVVMAIA